MRAPRHAVAVGILAAASLAPSVAPAATTTVTPATSYDGAYTVSWTNYTGLYDTVNLASSSDGSRTSTVRHVIFTR